jgi:hypothetical protein
MSTRDEPKRSMEKAMIREIPNREVRTRRSFLKKIGRHMRARAMATGKLA